MFKDDLGVILLKTRFEVAFIGGGNMAAAIIDAMLSAKIIPPSFIYVSDPSEEKRIAFNMKGINTVSNNSELRSKNIIFLAVKPQIIDEVLSEISDSLDCECLVSIAAGVSVEHIKSRLNNDIPVIRVLPNTPMLILDGMTVVAKPNNIDSEILNFVLSVFNSAGETIILPEEKINEAIPMSSSSPAFFFRMLHAMACEGVANGLSYDDAFKLSATAMRGSANYALQSKKNPEELIKQVSSPGGTTIAALTAFDDFDFEGLLKSACSKCIKRAYELGK